MPLIEDRFGTEKINFEVKTIAGNPMEIYNLTKELEIEKYSTIAVAGDDGTYQEAINGMLARTD